MTKILTDAARAKLTDAERAVVEAAESIIDCSSYGQETTHGRYRTLLVAINRLAAQGAPAVTTDLTDTEVKAVDLLKYMADARAYAQESNDAIQAMLAAAEALREAKAPPPAPPVPQGLTDEERALVEDFRKSQLSHGTGLAYYYGTAHAKKVEALLDAVDRLSRQPAPPPPGPEPKPTDPVTATPDQLARLGRIRAAARQKTENRYSGGPAESPEDGLSGWAVLWGDLGLLLTLLDAPRPEGRAPWSDVSGMSCPSYVEKEDRETRLKQIRVCTKGKLYVPWTITTRLWSDLEYLLKLVEQPQPAQPAPEARPEVAIYWHGCHPSGSQVCLRNTKRAAVYLDGKLAALVEEDKKRLSWTSSVLGLVIGEDNVREYVVDDRDLPNYDAATKTYSATPQKLSDLRAHLDGLAATRGAVNVRITELEAELAKLKQERETWTTKT